MTRSVVVSSLLALASVAHADISIQDVDVSAIPDLDQPGQAWDRISLQNYHVFQGLDVPLISITGTGKSWFLDDARLAEWTLEFPKANPLFETVALPDGTIIGGSNANRLRFMKRKGEDRFSPIPHAAGLYWTDHVEGSDVVFAKKSKNGPLLMLDREGLHPSPIPEHGHTQQGEFLPWYSAVLDGYFTAWAADIWFYREGDPEWRRIEEIEQRSWALNWGLLQRGSQDSLSPDGSVLSVISKNQLKLTQYRVTNGHPTAQLPALTGHWHRVGRAGDIVGWLQPPRHAAGVDEHTPQFVRFAPNSDKPEPFPNLRPLILGDDKQSTSYQYRFAVMPGTDRLYFLHDDSFAFYSDGEVTRLPADWLTMVGALPHFFATRHALFVAASNGLFQLGSDNTLIKVLATQADAGIGWRDRIFDLGCDGQSVGFFGWKAGIYALDPTGKATLLMQSQSPIRVYGMTPDERSVLFAEREGGLKVLSVEC